VTDTTAQFKSQLPRNSFFQALSFISNVAIGIWLVPYLMGHLGRAAYGLIPIAGALTQYVGLISYSISIAVTRFLTVALQRDDEQEANSVFNTAFFSYLAIGLIQIPVFAGVIYCANTVFSIPKEIYRDTIILLVCSAISFLINLVCSVFNVPIYANNRLDISQGLDIARQIMRLVGIVSLFAIFEPTLRYIGYVDLTTTLLLCAINIVIAKRLAPGLRVAYRYYDWSRVRQLTEMGWWLVVSQIGSLLFLRVDVWVCNRFIDAEAAGDYAAVLQWSNLIRQSGALIAGVTAPMIMIYYARGQVRELIRLSQLSVRMLCVFVAIPVSILCVFSSAILRLWLGESFTPLAPLMVVMLCHLTVNIGITPLFSARIAVNKVKLPALMSVAMGIINLFLAIFSVRYLGWGIYGVAVAGAVTLTLLNAFWNPIYLASVLHRPWHTFLQSTASGVLALGGLSLVGLGIRHFVHPTSWIGLTGASLGMGLIGLCGAWLILPAGDRQLLIGLLPGKRRSPMARLGRA
jgi:O-antigen/teichoic acid export membrane protein